jgi:hypothetical protein
MDLRKKEDLGLAIVQRELEELSRWKGLAIQLREAALAHGSPLTLSVTPTHHASSSARTNSYTATTSFGSAAPSHRHHNRRCSGPGRGCLRSSWSLFNIDTIDGEEVIMVRTVLDMILF